MIPEQLALEALGWIAFLLTEIAILTAAAFFIERREQRERTREVLVRHDAIAMPPQVHCHAGGHRVSMRRATWTAEHGWCCDRCARAIAKRAHAMEMA